MDVQVEVEFTVRHTIEELRQVFVEKGHFPDWRVGASSEGQAVVYHETRLVSVNLSTAAERQAWFVFSLEACGELRRRVVIPHVVPSQVDTHIPDLEEFLDFCRSCLVAPPGTA